MDNVISAQSLGFNGKVFDLPENVMRSLRNLIGDPVTRGREFLRRNAGMHDSITDSGTALK